ncbi:hypothetical protein HNY73_014591 [Argiope bruennichi]|uniref:Uncharacterized protein n=1 Tax=Argiope bruennichi TaxID=94029 RepID=A0A8T0ETW2_ARGBR|nr:hypothetical protein HNY73_014591 [Argiope bruennichi]
MRKEGVQHPPRRSNSNFNAESGTIGVKLHQESPSGTLCHSPQEPIFWSGDGCHSGLDLESMFGQGFLGATLGRAVIFSNKLSGIRIQRALQIEAIGFWWADF